MIDTLQVALKGIYCSLGGNMDNVRDENDINRLLDAIGGLNIGTALAAAKELPALPESDGTYSLQLVLDDGAATMTWEAVEE